jgi:hypothetical protein
VTATKRRRRPPRTLTPATVTRRYPAFRSSRLENWEAASDDGLWLYKRLEMSGTPWSVIHVPTGIEGRWCGTLDDAREATADGSALADVERLQAHDRGDHKETRDPRCIRC